MYLHLILHGLASGKRQRAVEKGHRADFCESCFRIAPHVVKETEESPFGLWTSNWRSIGAFQECEVCGSTTVLTAEVPCVSRDKFTEGPIDAMLKATRSASDIERIRTRDLDVVARLGEQGRLRKTLQAAMAQLDLKLPSVLRFSMAMGLMGAVFSGMTLFIILNDGWDPLLGWANVITWAILAAVCLLYAWRTHAGFAQKAKPRIERLLATTSTSFRTLQDMLDRQEVQCPDLRRHFRTHHYRDFRRREGRVL